MAIPHAKPGEIVNLRPLGAHLKEHTTTTLIKSNSLEVLRLVIPAGTQIAKHQVPGEITAQCLEGHVIFDAGGTDRGLSTGDLLFLAGGTPHALRPSKTARCW